MTLAVLLPDDEAFLSELLRTFSAINYFGRRGGFMQLTAYTWSDVAPDTQAGFVDVCHPSPQLIGIGFLQRMDNRPRPPRHLS
jgi:hypothetical protein